MSEPRILVAALAGVASFASPCMLPVLPAFLAGLGGTTLDEGVPRRRDVFGNAVAFVLGFAASFALVGVAVNAVLQGGTTETMRWVSRVAGVVVILFGLHAAGVVRFRPLDRTYRLGPGELDPSRPVAFLLGVAFAVGWTPCVGPLLGSTFALAAAAPGAALPVLLAYGVGLGVPFLLVALVPGRALSVLEDHRRTAHRVHRAFGVALLGMGVLVFTGRLSLVASVPLVEAIL